MIKNSAAMFVLECCVFGVGSVCDHGMTMTLEKGARAALDKVLLITRLQRLITVKVGLITDKYFARTLCTLLSQRLYILIPQTVTF